VENRVLDGNAAAGLLGEVFVLEVTAARSQCAACGAVGEVARLLCYADAPGIVLRCPGCSSVVLRMARTEQQYVLDLGGASRLTFDVPGTAGAQARG
jgi:hypothetical protein